MDERLKDNQAAETGCQGILDEGGRTWEDRLSGGRTEQYQTQKPNAAQGLNSDRGTNLAQGGNPVQGANAGWGPNAGQGANAGWGQNAGQGPNAGRGQRADQGQNAGRGQNADQSPNVAWGQSAGQGQNAGWGPNAGEGQNTAWGQNTGQGQNTAWGQNAGWEQNAGEGPNTAWGQSAGQGQYSGRFQGGEPNWYPDMENSGMVQPEQENHMALASMIMGILSIISACCFSASFILGGLAVMFAALSRVEEKMSRKGKTGLITGIIGIAAGLVSVGIWSL